MEGGGDSRSPLRPPLPPLPDVTNPSVSYLAEEYQVMSEVHIGCPPYFSGPYVSRFTFSLPPDKEVELKNRYDDIIEDELPSAHQAVSFDEDGDLVLIRRRRSKQFVMTIKHNITSSIPSVGLQVWKAELVLADFVLHKMLTSTDFDGIIAVELGAGTGLVGMLVARVAETVFLTDHGDEVLENCAKNVRLNFEMCSCRASIHVRELDWKASWPPRLVELSPFRERYSWILSEVEELHRASLLVAADVIYSDDLTDAFFSTLERIMSQGSEKVLYLALEKRYNFTLEDLNVVANGYSRFRRYLKVDGECDDLQIRSSPCFIGTCIDLTQIPQYAKEYNRGHDVEIWQIKYEKSKP